MAFEPFFLPVASGRRFCLLHRLDDGIPVRGAVVYVHPFAEEMNKSRRMAALQGRAMAAAGYLVLQIDLLGCGDSSGDFAEATWDGWVADVVAACAWLRQQTPVELWLWGLRAGCLLACAAAIPAGVGRFLFWQPVISGKQFLQQFLRLKVAGEMLAGEGKGLMERLRGELAQGKSIEVAGYAVSPALTNGLEQAELALPASAVRVEWLEVSAMISGDLSPAAAMRLEKWKAQGHAARGVVVQGPSFWQTTEIEECPALITATLEAMALDFMDSGRHRNDEATPPVVPAQAGTQ